MLAIKVLKIITQRKIKLKTKKYMNVILIVNVVCVSKSIQKTEYRQNLIIGETESHINST